jgi:beta-glucosidase
MHPHAQHRADAGIAGTAADEARERAVEAALGRLDLAAKAALLSGADMWSLPANPAIGLSRLVMSDGPAGVRGEQWTAEDPSLALPSPTAQAATWDTGLVREAGRALAAEARRKGAHLVLAPTVNLHRGPRGGRHFEAYSEDPLLAGAIGVAFVGGVQEGGVGTAPKHWVANDSETDRFRMNVVADERTLRELYLAPFEAIVRKARPWSLMAAYNGVNGPRMTEHAELNIGVLREEWGFDGMLVSDWMAARDTAGAALGGLDAAMPGPRTVYGERLAEAVREGRVPESVVDELAHRVLRLAARVGALAGAPAAVPAEQLPAAIDGAALARRIAARSFTLLRNNGVLPLAAEDRAPASIALIGLAGKEIRIGGSGSAQVVPDHVVSPLDGLRAALPAETRLVYELGTDPRAFLPAVPTACTARILGRDGSALAEVPLPEGCVRWIGRMPNKIPVDDIAEVVLTSTLRPGVAGTHSVAVRGVGRYTLRANGETLFAGDIAPEGTDFAALNPSERRFELDVPAGPRGLEPVELELRHAVPHAAEHAGFGLVSFTLGHRDPAGTPDELIERAVRAAGEAEVAVVVVGTTEEAESEGADRAGLAPPGRARAPGRGRQPAHGRGGQRRRAGAAAVAGRGRGRAARLVPRPGGGRGAGGRAARPRGAGRPAAHDVARAGAGLPGLAGRADRRPAGLRRGPAHRLPRVGAAGRRRRVGRAARVPLRARRRLYDVGLRVRADQVRRVRRGAARGRPVRRGGHLGRPAAQQRRAPGPRGRAAVPEGRRRCA